MSLLWQLPNVICALQSQETFKYVKIIYSIYMYMQLYHTQQYLIAICISYTTALRCIWVLYVRVTRARTYTNPYTPKRRGISDIYSEASYRYFGGTLRIRLQYIAS